MKKNNKVFLEHILEAVENIENFVKGIKTQEEFASDKKTRDAVLRNFQVIGEAANNLDEDLLNKSTDIEWEKVVGMRNFIIHEYFGVDLKIVWDTIKEDLPGFKESIKKLLENTTF